MTRQRVILDGEPCRWCGHPVHQLGGRLVHTDGDEGYCADGRHVAEVAPSEPRKPTTTQCRLCKEWYVVADVVDHWASCTGAKAKERTA